MNEVFVKWDEMHRLSANIAEVIIESKLKIDSIVGLNRGGLIPAVIISHMLDIPLIPISYSSKRGKGEYKLYNNDLPRIHNGITNSGQGELPILPTLLIVDDIADSGNTLDEISTHYAEEGHKIFTTVLHQKESACITANIYGKMISANSGWIIYPWE